MNAHPNIFHIQAK